jgi:hypothetical protein
MSPAWRTFGTRNHLPALPFMAVLGALTGCTGSHEAVAAPTGGSQAAPVAGAAGANVSGANAAGSASIQTDTQTEVDAGAFVAPSCTGALPVMKARDPDLFVDVDPDWSCYAAPGAPQLDPPVRMAAGTATFTLMPFIPIVVDGVTVDFFFGSSTLGKPDQTRVFAPGESAVTFDVPAGSSVVAAYVHAMPRDPANRTVCELREYGCPVFQRDAQVQSLAFEQDQLALVANLSLGGGQADPTKSLITSVARDCQGRELRGGQFELVDADTNSVVQTGTDPGMPQSAYFQNALPTTACTFTSNDRSAWVMVNAPVSVMDNKPTRRFVVRLKGRMRASDAMPVVIGESPIELFAGVLSLVWVHRETAK